MNSFLFSTPTSSLTRTQIYLSGAQQAALSAMARQRGSSSSAVIRLAVDEYISQHHSASKSELRLSVAGRWSAKHDTLNLRSLRSEERRF